MASIAKDKNGTRRILFVAPDGRRPTIRLGKVSQRAAESIKYRVEQLLEAINLNRPMEADLAQWVADLEPWLAKRLAAVGLIPNPEAKPAATLEPFLADFVERRIDVKPATKEVWSQVVRNLVDHFGADRGLDDVTEADAEDFKMYLVGQKLAPTTVAKRLQFARMFFKAAKRRKLIADNPFAEVSAKAVMRQDRQRFITPEETDRLLAVCNPTWRVIVALSRYGGKQSEAQPGSNQRGNVKVTREDWLDLAARVLVEHGVSHVKVLTLANRLKVSRSSFYWYFQSRKDLLDQLLDRWERQNTQAIAEHAARPADDICRAVMHLFECFIDTDQFDPRLDFAVREWARRDPQVRARLDMADEARVAAIRDVFTAHGFDPVEAFTRARVVYFMQIGYYALVENEPFEARFALLPHYLAAFTGQTPDAAAMDAFLATAAKLLKR